MVELKEEEKRLQFLLSRIDSEIEKFTNLLKIIETKQTDLQQSVTKQGFEPIPIKFKPHSGESQNLMDEIQDHLNQLRQLRNLTNQKLNIVVKEEELDIALHKKYNQNASIQKTANGDFEIIYTDQDLLYLYSEIMSGKKITNLVREELQKIDVDEQAEKAKDK